MTIALKKTHRGPGADEVAGYGPDKGEEKLPLLTAGFNPSPGGQRHKAGEDGGNKKDRDDDDEVAHAQILTRRNGPWQAPFIRNG